jgi:hypothetical protein
MASAVRSGGLGGDQVPEERICIMMNQASWTRFGKVLHRASYLKIGFYLLGFYYQFMTYFGPHREFVHNLCSSLFMFGLAMLMEGLRDNERNAEQRYGKPGARLDRHQQRIIAGSAGFAFAILLGLFMLFYARDQFQGEAILTFGIGGLAFFRLEYDGLRHALLLRGKAEAAIPVLPTRVSQDAAVADAGCPPETGRPTPPTAIP